MSHRRGKVAGRLRSRISLDGTAGVPLYVQIRERLRAEVAEMKPGTAIPVEAELEKRFRTSRITVRRAVEELVDEGLLLRQQGRGTFVQKPKLTHELASITSWTEQLRQRGIEPRTKGLEVAIEEPRRSVAEALSLARGERVVRIRRVRLAGKEPLSLMTNFVPERLVPSFGAAMLENESLYEVLERRYHLVPALAEDTVGARGASKEEAAALKIPVDTPVVSVRRVALLEDGTPLELALVASRGDRYEYRVAVRGRRRSG